MKHTLHLARRYLTRYWVRSLLLVLCMALAFLLPIAVHLLVGRYADRLASRAASTPFVAGARGSRYDLVLSSLYFRGRVPAATTMGELLRIDEDDLGVAIPLHAGLTAAKGHPVVGTTPDYYRQRNLRPEQGTLPLVIGDATLGADLAEALDLGPGDTVLTDKSGFYQFGTSYPLRLNIVGVLARTDSPDDDVVFTDIKSVWIAEGIGHGHDDATKQDDERVLSNDDGVVRLNAGVVTFTKIDAGNLGTFHFHIPEHQLPLTGILVWPHRNRERVKLMGRFSVSKTSQLLEPRAVIDEVLGFVFAIKRFFDANTLLVTLSTLLFLILVIWLSLRVREDEMDTYRKIGASRAFVVRLVVVELGLLVAAALVLALGCGWILARILSAWIGL